MSTPTPTLAAALWDFDGTLADTEPLWIEAEYELIGGLGGTWTEEQAKQLVGNSLLDSGAYILNAIGRRDLDPAWVVDKLVARVATFLAERPMPWRPGARELLTSFADANVPCALVSASYRVLLDAALSQLPAGTFTVTVAGDEVSQGKPHPEPYEKACALLGVDARDCVVFEDSGTGATSGNAAGALVIAVPNHVDVPAAPRRLQVASLAELDAAGVACLLEDARVRG
ncbi:HAD family hydrolase [uncultured Friedmanniella sp.]|uniref:HAD family hydrolase n=1 Tax=uncultured Friedmanniella sp. TaxID=335381 RepID=UPI0035CB7709